MEWEEIAAADWPKRKRRERRAPRTASGCTKRGTVYPVVVGRAGLSQPAAHGMQNIMLRRRAGTDAPYLQHRQHRDAPNEESAMKSGLNLPVNLAVFPVRAVSCRI